MKIVKALLGLLITLLPGFVSAQDIAGKWQATLELGQRRVRLIAQIAKTADGWNGKIYSIDQFDDWGASIPINSITLTGADLQFSVDYVKGSYQGKVSADGSSIQGTWTQAQALPLKFERSTPATEWKDPSPHIIHFVTVEANVKLEVLDWGGSGRPLVLLPGGGSTAHMYDKFALQFIPAYHVYAITRRGFGDSSAPASGYSADRLGDDVIAVLDALKLERPVLAGLSIAGEELSSVGSRRPDRVAGLIYLDAAYPYAFYNAERGDVDMDLIYLRKKLEQLEPGKGPANLRPVVKELLENDLPGFEKDLIEFQKDLAAEPVEEEQRPFIGPLVDMLNGCRKYTKIPVPILAIYAVPHDLSRGGYDAKVQAAMEARDLITTGAQADAFEKGVPTARVLRWPHARHNLVKFHEADVVKEMNAFLAGLK